MKYRQIATGRRLHPSSPARILLLALICLSTITALPSCGSKERIAPPLARAIDSSESRPWWSISLKFQWDVATPPRWALDELVALEIISPAITKYSQDIGLWRFHRRAADDASGHQFSFIFQASKDSSLKIAKEISKRTQTRELVKEGLLLHIFRASRSDTSPKIQDTSDSSWPSSIQTSWPYLMQGSSVFWLELVRSCTPEVKEMDTRQKLKVYEETHRCVTELWRENAQHAVFHHLNALFGYEPFTFEKEVRF